MKGPSTRAIANSTPTRRDMLLVGAIVGACFTFAVFGWELYGALFKQAPAQDFIVFYTAARSYIEGHLSLVFNGYAFTAKINEQFGAWFTSPLGLHPWVYPPLFLLMVTPLGILPFSVAYILFLVITFIFLNCAIRCYAPYGYQRWVCAVSLLLSPATTFTIVVGQNSFMTTALLVGGFGLMPRCPLLAGGLLGLLACKPQLWLLIPVALCGSRDWKALASAIATVCLIAIASAMVFGIEPWRAWLMLMLGPSPLYQHWLQFGRLNGQSAYTEAILLGAPPSIADLVQVLAILLCAALVWWCFRASNMQRDLQLAVLLTATILAAPHVSNYDTVMVAVAVSLFFCRALEDGFRSGEAIVIVCVWSVELLNPPNVIRLGLVTPLVLCLFLAAVITRGVRSARARQPRQPVAI